MKHLQLRERLNELKAEFTNGQKMLAEFKRKQVNLENSLLRISGAIQVLEELLAKENEAELTFADNQKLLPEEAD